MLGWVGLGLLHKMILNNLSAKHQLPLAARAPEFFTPGKEPQAEADDPV